jgi:dUTP pyrophosphatase
MPSFRVKKLIDDEFVPTRAHSTDSGLDLFAREDFIIHPRERKTINLGIAVEIPPGYGGFIQPRSGLAQRFGVTVLNTPGLIDSGYRGEIGVILYNTSNNVEDTVYFKRGDKIAQLVIISTPLFEPILSDSLNKTRREDNGFGSTDKIEVNKLAAYNFEE